MGSGRTWRTLVVVALVAATTTLTAAPAQADVPTFESTLVGPSLAEMYPSGFEFDAVNDRLVIADTGLDRVLLYSKAGAKLGEFGTPGSADGQFLSPRDTAVDEAGAIYVADAENNRVQKFTSAGAWVWTVGGVGSCNSCLNTPIGVTWDAANDQILVASTGQNLVKAFDANGAYVWKSPVTTTLGVGSPRDVQRGPDGRLWITDYKDHQMDAFAVDAAGVFASTTAEVTLGDGVVGDLNFPYNAVWSSDGNTIYVSDTGHGEIERFDLSGPTPVQLAPFGDHCAVHPDPCPDPPNASGEFNHLRRVAIDQDGNIYGADFWGNGIEVFTPGGAWLRSIAGVTAAVPGVAEAYGVAVGADGTTYVMDRLNQRVERFSATGTFLNHAGSRGTAGDSFSWPEAVAVAPDGTLWAADTRGDRISHWPADLATTSPIPTFGASGTAVGQFNWIEDLDVAANGHVYVADTRNHRIQVFNPATSTFTAFGSQGSANGQFGQPQGVAVGTDAVYVADTDNNRIQKLSLSGTWQANSSVALAGPQGLDVAADGTVWVADTANNRVVHLSADLASDLGDGFGAAGSGNTEFNLPHTLAVSATKLIVADTYNDRVQVYDLGAPGPGPLAPAPASQISDAGGVAPLYPAGGTADAGGTRYIADSGGSRIVKITSDGTQTEVLKAGLNDPRDVTFDSGGSDLWVADTSNSRIKRITTTGTVVSNFGGTAVFKTPYGLGNDASGVYVADTYNNRVAKIDKATGAILWSQNTCSALTFSRPRDAGIGSDANVYVADTDRNRVVVLNPSTGACVRTFGTMGGGNGQFRSPRSITSDGAGGIWVAEAWNYRAQHLTNTGAYIAKTSSSQGNGTGQFTAPSCVFLDAGVLNVCDQYGFKINRYSVNGSGVPAFVDTVGGTLPATSGFNGPFGTAYGPGGELYAVDWFNHRIQKFAPDGSFITAWGYYGSVDGAQIFPRNITVSPDGSQVVVTDSENNRIDVFTSAGTFVTKVKPLSGLALNRPHQTALAADGTYWIADTNNNRIVHLAADGAVLAAWNNGGQITSPRGIAVGSDGNIYVANTSKDKVEKYSPAGTLLATLATLGTGSTNVNDPHGLTISTFGGAERLFVADATNNRVVALTLAGVPASVFGTAGAGAAQFSAPKGVAVSPVDGDIAVADWANNRVSLWSWSGGVVPDTTPPDATVAVPTPNQVFPAGSVVFTGAATDNIGVAKVKVAIKNVTTNQWWNGTAWAAGTTFLESTLGSPGVTSTTWSYSWPSPGPGSYALNVRAEDASGNLDPTKPWVNFSVSSGPADSTPPNGTVAVPTAGQSFPLGAVAMSGSATDNIGVASVKVAIKNVATNQWWTGSGWGAFTNLNATLASPGATSTGWTYTWTPPAAGSYALSVRTDDAAGNTDPTKPWVTFSVTP